MPGIGLIKRRLETESQAIALATSHILKEFESATNINTLETKYDTDSGDWYVALGWQGDSKKAIIQMDSILGTVTSTKEL